MVSQLDAPATKGDMLALSTALDGKLDTRLGALETKLGAEMGRTLGVAVEQLTSQWRAVWKEGVENVRESLERRMSELETRLTERMGLVERAVRDNSTELQGLRGEVASIRIDLDGRDARLDDLEARMSIVEKRLGIR